MSKVNLQSLEKADSMPIRTKVSRTWVNSPRNWSVRGEPTYWAKYRAVKRAGINKPWDETVEKLKKILPEYHHDLIREDRVQLDSQGVLSLVDSNGAYIGRLRTAIPSSKYDFTYIDLEGILRRIFYRRLHFTPKNIKSLRQQKRKKELYVKACKEAADYKFKLELTKKADRNHILSTDKIRLQVDNATVPVKTFNSSNGMWEHQGATAPQYTYFTVKEFMYFCEVRNQTYALEINDQFLTNVKL